MMDPEKIKKIKKGKVDEMKSERNVSQNGGPKDLDTSKKNLRAGIERAARFKVEEAPENLPIEELVPLEKIDLGAYAREQERMEEEFRKLGENRDTKFYPDLIFAGDTNGLALKQQKSVEKLRNLRGEKPEFDREAEDIEFVPVENQVKQIEAPKVELSEYDKVFNRLNKLEKRLGKTPWWDYFTKRGLKKQISFLESKLEDLQKPKASIKETVNNFENSNFAGIEEEKDKAVLENKKKQEKKKIKDDYRALKEKTLQEQTDRSSEIETKEAELKRLKQEDKEKATAAFNARYEATKKLPLTSKFLERGKIFTDNNEGRKILAKKAGFAALLLGIGSLTGGGMIAAGVPSVVGVVGSGAATGAIVGSFKSYFQKWTGKISPEEFKKKLIVNAAIGAGFGATGAYFFPYVFDGIKNVFVGDAAGATLPTESISTPAQQEFRPEATESNIPNSTESPVAPEPGEIVEEIVVPGTPESTIFKLEKGESVWSLLSNTLGLGENVAGNAHKLHGKEIAEYIASEIKKQNLPVGDTFSSLYERLLANPNITGREKFWRILPTGLNLDMAQILKIITK